MLEESSWKRRSASREVSNSSDVEVNSPGCPGELSSSNVAGAATAVDAAADTDARLRAALRLALREAPAAAEEKGDAASLTLVAPAEKANPFSRWTVVGRKHKARSMVTF